MAHGEGACGWAHQSADYFEGLDGWRGRRCAGVGAGVGRLGAGRRHQSESGHCGQALQFFAIGEGHAQPQAGGAGRMEKRLCKSRSGLADH